METIEDIDDKDFSEWLGKEVGIEMEPESIYFPKIKSAMGICYLNDPNRKEN